MRQRQGWKNGSGVDWDRKRNSGVAVTGEKTSNQQARGKESLDGHRVLSGIDVGSVSTNLVVIDEKGSIVKKIYLRTEGNP